MANCCIALSLVLFVLPNVLVLVAGGLMVALAALALVWPQVLVPAYAPYLRVVYTDVYTTSEGAVDSCYHASWATDDSALAIEWRHIPLATTILLGVGALGAWLAFWAIWGLMSLCRCCHRCFLVLLTVVQIATLVALPVALLLAYVPFKSTLVDHLGNSLNTTMERDYYARPSKGCTSFKLAFDAVQYQGYCCAVDGYVAETDQRLQYSPVCSAGTMDNGPNTDYQGFPGCLTVIRHFLDKECLLWLGIGIGILCVLLLLEIIAGLVVVGLWRRDSHADSVLRSRNYLASERDGFISDKDMEQYYAPGQFTVPASSQQMHHNGHHHHGRRKL